MAVDLTLKKVHGILSDVAPDKAFCLKSGRYLRNMHELFDALKFMDDDVFLHHVNTERNDFYNWLIDAVGDDILAQRLKPESERARYVEIIEHRLDELEAVEKAFNGKIEKEAVASKEEINQAICDVKKKPKKHSSVGSFLLGFFIGLLLGLLIARFLMNVL